jgi:H+/Cl- antiporter ClcA
VDTPEETQRQTKTVRDSDSRRKSDGVTSPAAPPTPESLPDPVELLRSKSYLALLVIGAVIGVPVAAFAYFFLKLVAETQQYVFTTLPNDLGFHGMPAWWPVPLLMLSGLVVAATIKYLPGTGGHSPADGFHAAGAIPPIELPGIILAAFATLSLGVVLGPEAPLIAIGSGLGVLAIHLIKKDAPPMAAVVVGVAGSFAAIATLLGSPIVGAFLLMEAAGLGGAILGVVLVPGLLAAGVGALIFVGLDNWTGFGTFSLKVANLPTAASPTVAEFLWAIGIGIAAAVLAAGIKRLALAVRPIVARKSLLFTPIAGLAIGVLVLLFTQTTTHSFNYVLFSGQDQLPALLESTASWTVGALLLLIVCKGLAYGISLSSFRGGPVFPGLFIGAAGGVALSHVAGLPMIAGAAMGMAAMTTAMLGLPLTSVMLTTLFLGADGITLMPVVIVAAAISYVASARLAPAPPPAEPVPSADPGPSATGASAPGAT